jgi:type IV secretory pathway ATPase VirB11/archaellum biosynthesis ATPase
MTDSLPRVRAVTVDGEPYIAVADTVAWLEHLAAEVEVATETDRRAVEVGRIALRMGRSIGDALRVVALSMRTTHLPEVTVALPPPEPEALPGGADDYPRQRWE